MTPVDYIIAAAVLLSLLFGAVRGFLRESVALLGWLVGLWLAWRYAYVVEPYLGGALADTELQSGLAARTGADGGGDRQLAARRACSAGWCSARASRSGVDRMLGGLFGLVRGAVIVGFAVMLGQAAELQDEPWWRESKLMPFAVEMAGGPARLRARPGASSCRTTLRTS